MKSITITGPRSIGKTTISKLVAKKLKLKYISSDEIGEKVFKKKGGLDKATKSGFIGKLIKEKGYTLIKNVYQKEKNFVFDLSGGAFTSRKTPVASSEVREIAKKKTKIIGLLPSKNFFSSILFLYKREKQRAHFKEVNKLTILKNTINSYLKFPKILKENCDFIIYVKEKSPVQITKEIINCFK